MGLRGSPGCGEFLQPTGDGGIGLRHESVVVVAGGVELVRPIEGLISHVAIVSDDGLRVLDVWTSREALEGFRPVIVPATKAAGFPDATPRLSHIHDLFPA